QWTKLETANTTYAEWIAAISGKMGATTADGFVLENATVQVFERKSKAAAQPDVANAEQSDSATPTNAEPSGDTNDVPKQAVPESGKAQAESVDPAKSTAKPEEKSDPKAKPSAEKSEQEPKKIKKFKVQIR
ncbi:MAG TPA: hypothetical protein DEV81_06155, partial [Cyanobacteria bacterium UBA11049]|nr:hypothetical protein [Cyanobacteria bacterium UBA11049]